MADADDAERTDDAPITRRRLEGLSDGIMAVAITLLALNIQPPKPAPGQSLWQALDTQVLGSIAIFLFSFFMIARYWLLHHEVFERLPNALDYRIVIANFAFLATICLMPFATSLYSQNTDDVTAFATYAVSLALGSALISVLFALSGEHNRRRALLIPAIFLAGIPVAMVVGASFAPMTWLVLFAVPNPRRKGRSTAT